MSGTSVAGGDPVNNSDPSGLRPAGPGVACALQGQAKQASCIQTYEAQAAKNDRAPCLSLNCIANDAGVVQLAADGVLAIPVIGEIAAPVAVPISEIAGAVNTGAVCVGSFEGSSAFNPDTPNCFYGLTLYSASGGLLSLGSAAAAARFGEDVYGYILSLFNSSIDQACNTNPAKPR